MAKDFKRFTITAALPYTNGPVHIGHLAGVYIPADIYVRYLRSRSRDVVFVCGSDEMGIAITLKAKREGTTPQAIVDRYHKIIKDSFEDFGISFDIYSRTSSSTHAETSSNMFKELYERGVFEEKVSEQYYDEEHQQFLADRYIKGICPNCGFEEAYGDQCENCGTSLSPTELINPVSVLSGANPVRKETRHWYLPMDEYEDWLREWILEEHKEWKPNVYGQCKSWINLGLKPRAMTRDLDWGVPVPVEGAEGKVLYVWFDAPIGYISATRDWAKENNKDWEPYWKGEDTRLIHFIGKDNIVFHCIIFPSILKAEGSYVLPDNVPANEFLNLENDKISTSRNWAVWLHEYLEDFPNKQDVLRYALTAIAPETKDSDFTWKDFQARNNNELVAIYGNFINRALVLTHKYFEGKVPELGKLETIDENLVQSIKDVPGKVAHSLEQFKFREALANLMELARMGNKYLADTEPWKLIKEDKERVGTILNLALQISANLYILSEPFLPFSSNKLRGMLNLPAYKWDEAGDIALLSAGQQLNKPELLFEKIDDKEIVRQVEKLESTKRTNQMDNLDLESQKETINFDDFLKMDMRVGTILEAEKMPKSDKLLKLIIDTGLDKRTVLSGIAQHYSPEEIIGQQVCVLVNLAPRKMMGIESQGMVLMAETLDGTLAFMQPDQPMTNGGTVR